MIHSTSSGRVRAFGYFIIAAIYFEIARVVAVHAARGLVSGQWFDLADRAILLFLLLVGYGAMGRAFENQQHPIRSLGLVFRQGWSREFGLGAALGWGMLLASILPMVLAGGLLVTFWTFPRNFGTLVIDLVLLAVASLGEEVAFRGYPFQRLIEAIGPTLATLVVSLLFGLLHLFNPGITPTSFIVTILSGWLLAIAYLRTRALWLCWGWHFAWNASMALLFGLPMSGITRFSPVIQSDTIGPTWMTGGDYGPEASGVALVVLLAGIVVLFRVTRAYAYDYAQPVIHAAGMPVDLDAMSRTLAPHHDEAPAKPKLIQIGSIPSESSGGSFSAPEPASARPVVPAETEPSRPADNEPV